MRQIVFLNKHGKTGLCQKQLAFPTRTECQYCRRGGPGNAVSSFREGLRQLELVADFRWYKTKTKFFAARQCLADLPVEFNAITVVFENIG
jgi:hypothetical protein